MEVSSGEDVHESIGRVLISQKCSRVQPLQDQLRFP